MNHPPITTHRAWSRLNRAYVWSKVWPVLVLVAGSLLTGLLFAVAYLRENP